VGPSIGLYYRPYAGQGYCRLSGTGIEGKLPYTMNGEDIEKLQDIQTGFTIIYNRTNERIIHVESQ
jgi:hypothetical protein